MAAVRLLDYMEDKFNVAVVIPAYKAEKYISRTIESIFKQKKVNLEIVVVIDGILDETNTIVEHYKDKVKTIIFEKNQGAQKARNKGLSIIESDYVMFLDADDYLEGETFLYSLADSINKSDSSLAFGPMKKIGDNYPETIIYPKAQETSLEVLKRWLLGNSGPGTCSVLWRVSEIKRIGGWNENVKRNQDGEIIIRAMLNNCSVSSTQEGMGVYWQYDSSNRVSKLKTKDSYLASEIIEKNVLRSFSDKKMKFYLSPYLEHYRLGIALRAYENQHLEEGLKWEKKWKHYITYDYLQNYNIKSKLLCFLVILLGFYNTSLLMKVVRLIRFKIKSLTLSLLIKK